MKESERLKKELNLCTYNFRSHYTVAKEAIKALKESEDKIIIAQGWITQKDDKIKLLEKEKEELEYQIGQMEKPVR